MPTPGGRVDFSGGLLQRGHARAHTHKLMHKRLYAPVRRVRGPDATDSPSSAAAAGSQAAPAAEPTRAARRRRPVHMRGFSAGSAPASRQACSFASGGGQGAEDQLRLLAAAHAATEGPGQPLKPATRVASGFCIARSSWLRSGHLVEVAARDGPALPAVEAAQLLDGLLDERAVGGAALLALGVGALGALGAAGAPLPVRRVETRRAVARRRADEDGSLATASSRKLRRAGGAGRRRRGSRPFRSARRRPPRGRRARPGCGRGARSGRCRPAWSTPQGGKASLSVAGAEGSRTSVCSPRGSAPTAPHGYGRPH